MMNILIVDDDATNLKFFAYLLQSIPETRAIPFSQAEDALRWCHAQTPDLVLIDYLMPDMNGLEFLSAFRALHGMQTIPVIMATADMDNEVRHRALEMSANDFLTKPVNRIELRARVTNMLALRRSQLQLANRAEWLAEEVAKATRALHEREREVIFRLSRVSEYRDPETGAHILRMAHIARLIARNLGLPLDEQELLLDATPMHDVGKMGIPDHILLKPGPLSAEELQIMRTHAHIGAQILSGSNAPLLQAASQIALSHHEKYDGSGYPNGLTGEAIPLYGRITAVADVFDALTSKRPYKAAWSIEDATDYIRQASGSHFDPRCVAAFFQDWPAVLRIRAQYHE